MGFELDVFYSRLVSGRLRCAMDYLKSFPEQSERYDKYLLLFEKENYLTMAGEGCLDDILRIYQRYYRDLFYLECDKDTALEKLRTALSERFGPGDMDELECRAAEVFKRFGFEFQGGRTGGYYGPYIWKSSETAEYKVELPEGCETYRLRFLDGFISKSWLDYLSFGEVSTGGWADGDGLINCVRASYDIDSEDFTVSLLKHEAQHELDLRRYPGLGSTELEYRAKLVELIYSVRRNLLPRFAMEAAASDGTAGHGAAARRITDAITEKLSGEQIRSRARELFEKSCAGMKAEFDPIGK